MVLEGSRGSCSRDGHDATLLWMELYSPGLACRGLLVAVVDHFRMIFVGTV